tara:strand:- start:258 stop:1427 length:1170 start_codon:yes stop_codon:yes gene_type:complete
MMATKTKKPKKPRYLVLKTLSDQKTAYYYEPPKDAIAANIVERQALGVDWERATARAIELNERIDEWRKHEKGNPHLREQVPEFSVKKLCSDYLESNNFQRLKNNTKRDYRKKIKEIEELPIGKNSLPLGQVDIRQIMPSNADKIYSLLKIGKKGQLRVTHANGIMRILRLMFNLAKKWYDLPQNPFENPALQRQKRRTVSWEDDQLEKFCETALSMNLPSIYRAAMIARETGLRVTDVRTLKWSNIQDDFIEVLMSKTDKTVWVPISPKLKEVLGVHRGNSDDYVLKTDGKNLPYTETRISQIFAKVRREAGLPADLQMRDFRGTMLNELADAGVTEDELMAISGHMHRETLKHYVHPRKNRSSEAFAKLEKRRNSMGTPQIVDDTTS